MFFNFVPQIAYTNTECVMGLGERAGAFLLIKPKTEP
jgi:hypothetical protein